MRAMFWLVMACASAFAAEAKTDLRVVDAAESKNWDQLDVLLDAGADHQAAHADGMTALHWAVFHNAPAAVDALIAASEAEGKGVADEVSIATATTEYEVTPLAIACERGNRRIVQRLLGAGAKVDQRTNGQITPLLLAARTGASDVIACLIENGAKLDATERKGQTALMWAAAAGHEEAVKRLLDAGADRDAKSKLGFTALLFAARNGQMDVCQVLVDAGVDVNAVIEPTFKTNRTPRKGSSALTLAVESGHFELAMFLIENGADPNDQRNGFAPLHAMSWVRRPGIGEGVDGDPPPRGSGTMNSLQFVRALAEAGADVNLRLEKGKSGKAFLGGKGATPMLFASKTADLSFMSLLVELGADPSLANADGCTPLMAAAGIGVRSVDEEPGTESEVIEAIEFLIQHGNDVNAVDDNKETAMHGAGYRCFPRVVKFLAENGSDPATWNHKNVSGWTPVMIAKGHRPGSFKPHPETVQAMEAMIESAKAPSK